MSLSAFSIWNQQVLVQAPVEHGFNPSICPHPTDSTKRIFAFRSVVGNWEQGKIWVGVVDAIDLQFLAPPKQLCLEPEAINCEDPRLYSFDGELWIGYTTSDWSKGPTMSYQHLAAIHEVVPGDWECEMSPVRFASPFGHRQEKNWIFFVDGAEELHALYSAYPEWRIHQCFTDHPAEYVLRASSRELKWPFGQIRGGTPLIVAPNGNWWTFFHSSMHHHPAEYPTPFSYYHGRLPEEICDLLVPSPEIMATIGRHGRYFCGLLEIDRRTLLPCRISGKPLLYQNPPSEGRCGNHVIWPAGAFREGDEVTVAYGLDDRTCHCARFSALLLEELLRECPPNR